MLKTYMLMNDLLAQLRRDKGGVVSFEYVIVAACIVGAVGLAFGTGSSGAIATALSNAITAIAAKVTAATS